ncbi:MAG: bifunctional 3-deoxy-7-phosphoheptulonate synthase/chorismate mutase type II [Bacteroidetes bacterium]|nr:bifunctional 3-deoxy-7-phosphoheptulonate synthase/chorismate mutase type II [Bacteroidota bacterium]MBL6943422.1 bifunctional 3-deoxy-7-phosphoheptulonate synthase/chorismate mutase type II [Bacteroidales bacterium]
MSPKLKILPLNDWIDTGGKPLVIAGPCSAESEEQLLKTARQLASVKQLNVFRAGIWKPRTRPGDFDGVGEVGLSWLKQVKNETGLLTTVEVADSSHVELALKHDVDILWIGARTVGNPFSVQAIAEVLTGVDIPVMVKNPLNPDINLWLGAIERINAAGINKLIAIHRGFHYFEKSPFRNAPMWEIPIELKRIAPMLPIVVDPSHICGRPDLIESIAQKALDLEMDGLMIESHHDPENAFTDAAQQITPDELQYLLNKLVIRVKSGDINFQHKLEELRTEIDKLDGELLQILAKRMEIVDEIGDYKKENDITILQMKRWAGIINDRMSIGTHLGLEEGFLKKLLNLIHKESIQRQENIFQKK